MVAAPSRGCCWVSCISPPLHHPAARLWHLSDALWPSCWPACHLPLQGMLPASRVSAEHIHPCSHLNCRALGRGPCCSPTAIMGPESCVQLCHHSKKSRRGRGEAPVLPVPWKSSSPLAQVLSAQHPSKPPPPLKAVFSTSGTGRGMCTKSPLGTTPRCSFLLAK